MKLKYLAALLALTVTQGAVLSPVFAQDVKNINKWFDDINKKYPNLQKKQNVGDLQNPGKLQTPGKIQNAGNINAPQGLKAIKTTSAPCSQRFLIGADTLFEFDQATLTPRAEETLTVLGPMIQNVGAHPVVIEGHTDSKGTDDYNQQLSERRAERVRNWFLEHRIVEKRAVSTVGYGEKKPVAPNEKPDGKDNPPGRALNRRVEIVVNTCAGIDEPAVTTAPSATTPPATTSETVPSTEAAATGGITPSSETPVSKEAAADLPPSGNSNPAITPIVPDANAPLPDVNAPLPEKPIESK